MPRIATIVALFILRRLLVDFQANWKKLYIFSWSQESFSEATKQCDPVNEKEEVNTKRLDKIIDVPVTWSCTIVILKSVLSEELFLIWHMNK